jgi:prepilin-type N-terminal cleavage/methylation domain-containing protein
MKRGFTIIEVLIMLAIAGILIAIVSGFVTSNKEESKPPQKEETLKRSPEEGTARRSS